MSYSWTAILLSFLSFFVSVGRYQGDRHNSGSGLIDFSFSFPFLFSHFDCLNPCLSTCIVHNTSLEGAAWLDCVEDSFAKCRTSCKPFQLMHGAVWVLWETP
ncbi:hypothetical protein HOY82DRAFT_32509 [Tuber indicum]|nr:hypothetical protein HOY82DRAFT_32509 [Tuber indicum]